MCHDDVTGTPDRLWWFFSETVMGGACFVWLIFVKEHGRSFARLANHVDTV